MRLLAFLLVLATGCRYGGTFTCETSDQCGTNGTCEPTQFCSFPDSMCALGQRYDETAGPYAGACVGEEPRPDGGIDAPDGAPFDLTSCPSGFGAVPNLPGSRYAIHTPNGTFWAHHAYCNALLPGATHLLIPDTAQELDILASRLSTTVTYAYVGAVQDAATATLPNAAWFKLDGQPLDAALWGTGDPDDDDDIETDHYSQTALLSRASRRLDDAGGATARPALCECDGKSVAASVEAIIAADPNKN
ncbi:MAG TPA: hypothetical protein VMZ53_01400 [Kofleriaceae bacterium]|nr:hypothetical protein [Kofleriaceae bacterium]